GSVRTRGAQPSTDLHSATLPCRSCRRVIDRKRRRHLQGRDAHARIARPDGERQAQQQHSPTQRTHHASAPSSTRDPEGDSTRFSASTAAHPQARESGHSVRMEGPNRASYAPQGPMSCLPEELKQAALEYHRHAPAGKIRITPTKSLLTARDLSLAYSPGVAAACEEIVRDPIEAHSLTARGNLVGVITNGTAVLGLGSIGALAGKPVMEGKGVLFRKFAGIDVFDIEIDERDPDKLVEIIAALEPTFGGINLEDIKAPECFYVERKLRERMHIPVFHDDQHGTAIIVGAALTNALIVVGKKIGEVKVAASGAGAAGIACLDMLVRLGVKPQNILVGDKDGVLYQGRPGLDPSLERYARKTRKRTLADIVKGADVFLGVSAGGVLKREMVATMADRPVILALANPTPEIIPEEARAAKPDAVIATGRSDYPNQVNNALCFPYIFRGALDVGATGINEAMTVACVHAIAKLARREASDVAQRAYGGKVPHFGAEYLIPRPFDPRLLVQVAPAVAKAAMESGVAMRPLADL